MEKFKVDRCDLSQLNPKGVANLCQAVLASGIKDMDEDFINSSISLEYLDNGFPDGSFGPREYRKLFQNYKKNYKNVKKEAINVSEFVELQKTMSPKELSEHFGRSIDALKCFCYRKGIDFSKTWKK